MIYLFTDFGWAGPYVGEMKAVVMRALPGVGIVDLMHDAPAFNPRASAYLLAALSRRFVSGDICLAVVDPGVGDQQRRALVLEAGGIHYIGPDNGLFAVIARRAVGPHCEEIIWRPASCSDSFHGRDIFAPIVTRVHAGENSDSRPVSCDSLVGMDYPEQLAEVIYIDHYGNAVTGMCGDDYSSQAVVCIAGGQVKQARTFSSVPQGEVFWYINSMGLVEIAANKASAAEVLGLETGTPLAMLA